MMVGLLLFPLFALFAVVLTYGLIQDWRQRTDVGADALALAYANQMEDQPRNLWSQSYFDPYYILQRNGVMQGVQLDAVTRFPTYPPLAISATDRWAPAMVSLGFSVVPNNLGTEGLVRTFLGGTLPRLNTYSMARVNQVELATFSITRERVLLMLDFSRSMRLPYTGAGAGGGGLDGRDVMISTGQTVLSYFQRLFDVGLMTFSDLQTNQVTDALASNCNALSSTEQENRVSAMSSRLGAQATSGDGTDIALAVQAGVEALNSAACTSGGSNAFSIPRLVVVTDGEPDVGQSVSTSASYEDKVQQASAQATAAVHSAWDSGVMTSVAYMQREGSLTSSAETFLSSIAGGSTAATANPNMYYADAGVSTGITNWLESQPVFPFCQSNAFDNTEPPTPLYLQPQLTDPLHAYFDIGQGGAETPVGNIFFNMNDFITWSRGNGVVVSANPQTGLYSVPSDVLTNSQNLGLYYDFATHSVWLSPAMCAAIYSEANANGVPGSGNMRVRLRWGVPRIVTDRAEFGPGPTVR